MTLSSPIKTEADRSSIESMLPPFGNGVCQSGERIHVGNAGSAIGELREEEREAAAYRAGVAKKLRSKDPRTKSGATARKAFNAQKWAAMGRGVAWEFTFEAWLEIWMASGKWPQRGQASGDYCMARNGDVGPYASGNVRIITNAQNAKERDSNTPPSERKKTPRKIGWGQGWLFIPKAKKRPYDARVRGKSVGRFATKEEAIAAYQAAVAADPYVRTNA